MVITSARKLGEPVALVVYALSTIFHMDNVSWRLHLKFITSVILDFYMNQTVCLLVFFPELQTTNEKQIFHSLDMRRALAFCLQRTKPFRRSPRLFVVLAECMKGQEVSEWILDCILLCYQLFDTLCTVEEQVTPPEQKPLW